MVAQISLAYFICASNGLCLLVLSRDAFGHHKCKVEQFGLWKLGQITKEEYKRLVCEPGRTEPKGQGTK